MGTEHEIILQRNEPPPEPDAQPAAPQGMDAAAADRTKASTPESDNGGFNLDGILDLMAGDDKGNVDFGAIGLEVASNLANIIDMNEVGSMATTLGMMLSGLGAVNEIQRQGNLVGADMPNPVAAANLILNSGISTLIGQVLSNQIADNDFSHLANLLVEPPGATGRSRPATGGGAAKPARMAASQEAAGIANMLASVQAGGLDVQQLAGIFNDIVGAGGPATGHSRPHVGSVNLPPSRERQAAPGGQPRVDIGSLVSKASGGDTRSIASAVADLVNGNDTAGFADIAQAIGVRNFIRVEDKKVPDGCPSCFNCMYPGSVCAHNATCNQYTGRCDCPSGWTGEDCLQPGKNATSHRRQSAEHSCLPATVH
ncbi:FAD-dependent urate hydroxylase [Coemansia spiralis]|nr:FAD-dependent urate hydroxylase [Coemansia spiralis]